MNRSAIISECGSYRYQLIREWAIGPRVMWLMLNPSTADASVDDPTIKRCIAFSAREGFGSMVVGNLYAYRATNPHALYRLTKDSAHGPKNSMHLWQMALRCRRIICAWGANEPPQQLALLALPKVPDGMWCLGRTRSGSPRHPLYLPMDTLLESFP